MRFTKIQSFYIFFCVIHSLFAQQNGNPSIEGHVENEFGKPLENIEIIVEGYSRGAVSNQKGDFVIKNVPSRACTIVFSGLGIQERRVTIEPNNNNNNFSFLSIKLQNSVSSMSEVVVLAKTRVEKIEESGFAVDAIDVKELKDSNIEVTQVLKRSEGIQVRLSGGVGSNYNFSLNGLSGNRVRFFVDELPVTYLGSIYDLNNIPVNIVDNIEVYKGVVPIFLGADALAGAVNINTFKSKKSFIDASYSYGSFNTNKLTINSQYRNQHSGLTIRPKLYFLSSDNDYTVYNKEVYNRETFEWETLDVDRFHDYYSSISSIVEIGYTDVKWVDELLIGHSYNSVNDDEQTDTFGNPIGEVVSKEESSVFSLKFKKTKLFNDKLDIKFTSIYNEFNRKIIDTSSNRYNWSGQITRVDNDNSAELFNQKTIYEYEQSNFLSRAFIEYRLNDKQSIKINNIFSFLERQGEDRLGVPEDEPFRSPNLFKNNFTGLAYETNWFNDKLNVNLGGKYYYSNLSAKNAVVNNNLTVSINDVEKNLSLFGYYIASRIFINTNFFIKASYEKGVRFPDDIEIFGDGLLNYSNPNLEPEKSHNFNLGFDNKFLFLNHKLKTKFNFFYRELNNYIDDTPFTRGIIYENLNSVLIYGGEFSFNYYYKERLNINGNLTRIYNLNNEKYTDSNQLNFVFGDQLPNEPYLFGNASIFYDAIVNKPINLSVNYNFNFVNEFFLGYESIATAGGKNTIPKQLVHSLGTTLKFHDNKYSLSLECNNVFDSLVYDNFNIQNPGRSLSFKLRCNIL